MKKTLATILLAVLLFPTTLFAQTPVSWIRETTGGNRVHPTHIGDSASVGTSTAYAKFNVWGNSDVSGWLANFANSASTSVLSILNSGNVGIGTTSPYHKLSISGNAPSLFVWDENEQLGTEVYSVGSIGGLKVGSAVMVESDGSTYSANYGPGSGYYMIGTNNTERIRVEGGGDVGIGTNNPTTKLEVSGTAKATTFQRGSGSDGCATWTSNILSTASGPCGSVTSIATNNGLTGGTITTSGTIGLNTAGLSVNAPVTWNGTNLAATGTPSLTVGYLNSTSTSDTSTFKHSVHIGGGESADFLINWDGNTGTQPTFPTEEYIRIAKDVDFTLATPSQSIEFSNNAGNVGFLTHVGSTLAWNGNAFGSSDDVYFTSEAMGLASSSPYAKLSVVAPNVTGTALAVVGTDFGLDDIYTPILIAKSNGNVGIGTSSPYAKLSVNGQAVAQYFTGTSTTPNTFPNASTTNTTVSSLTDGRVTLSGPQGRLMDDSGLAFNRTTDALTVTGAVTGSNLSGTNTGNVTLAGENYLSLSGQQITAADVNLTSNVTGDLPFSNIDQIPNNVVLGNITGSTADVQQIDPVTLFQNQVESMEVSGSPEPSTTYIPLIDYGVGYPQSVVLSDIVGIVQNSIGNTLFGYSGYRLDHESVSANISVDGFNGLVSVNATGGNRTATMTTTSMSASKRIIIMKSDASANTVTVTGLVTADKVILTQYGYVEVVYNGSVFIPLGERL